MIVYPTGKIAADYQPGDYPDYRNDDYYATDYSLTEIQHYLQRVKQCVKNDKFYVLDDEGGSRAKNRDFMLVYGLTRREEQRAVLLSLDAEDFCHSVTSSDGSRLYVFCVERSLYKASVGPTRIWVYIKHNCPDKSDPYDLVVSMHELEMPIDLLFVD